MPHPENTDGYAKKIRDNPDLAKHEMDLEKVLKKPFQKDDLGRGELENPADFLRHIHGTSPELESILDRTPEEKKDEVQRALDELIQSELMERWKKETNDKQKELENSVDTSFTIQEADIKNDNFNEKEKFTNAMMQRASLLKEGLSEGMKQKIESYMASKIDEQHISWQTRHNIFHQQEITEGKNKINNALILSSTDIENDSFHDEEVFKQEMKQRADAATEEVPDDLKNEMEQHFNEKSAQLFREWKTQHEALHQKEINEGKQKIDEAMRLDPTDIENDEFHDEETFQEAMNERAEAGLGDIPDDLKDIMRKYIEEKSDQLHGEWKAQHEEFHQKEIKEGKDKIDGAMKLETADIENDEFHDEKVFQEAMKQRAELALGDIPDDLKEVLKKHLEEKTEKLHKEWATQHEAAEQKKITAELLPAIVSGPIPPEMTKRHMEAGQFKGVYWKHILGTASDGIKKDLKEHPALFEKIFQQEKIQSELSKKFKVYEGGHDNSMEKRFSGELETSLDAFWITPEMFKKPLSKEQFSDQVFSQLFKNSSPELQAELKEHKGLREKLMSHGRMQPIMTKKYKKFQQLLQAKTSKEEESKDPQNKEKKEKAQLSTEDLEKNSERDLSKGLAKYIDMEKGRSRLMELKKLPAIRKLFQNDTLKRSFSPFLTEWAAQLKSSEFRLFKLSIQKPDTTPEQMLQSMTGNLQRRKATHRIKKFSSATWTRFSQGLRQLHIAPTSLLTPNAYKPAENTEEPTGIENEPLEDLEALSEAELMEELEAENLEEEDEEGLLKNDTEDEETAEQDEEMEEGSVTQKENESADDRELSADKDEETENEEDDEPLKTERVEDEMDEAESNEESTHEEKDDEDENALESEEDAVTMMGLEEGQEGLLQELSDEEQKMKDDEETSAELNPDEEEDSSEKNSTNPLSEEENDGSEFHEDLEQLERLTTEESVQELSPETSEQIHDEKDQEGMTKTEGETMSDDADERMREEAESEDEISEDQFQNVEDISDDHEEMVQQMDHLEEQPNQAGQKELEIQGELHQDEETEHLESAEVSEKEEVEESLQKMKKDEENDKNQVPIDEKRKISPTPEKKVVVPLVEKKEKRTDPLKELERFRKELISRLRQNVKIPKTGIQHEFEALVGVPTEIAEEERSEFLETLRLEMETYSMSLRTLIQKFVRYIRFVNDSEIPAFLQLPHDLLDRLVIKPGEVFQQLNDFYFKCREKHEDFPRLIFTTSEKIMSSDTTFTLQFEVHKKTSGKSCRALIPCFLVEEEERRVPQAA